MNLYIDTNKLTYSRGLQARAICAAQWLPVAWSVEETMRRFVKDNPEYNESAWAEPIKRMILGRGVSDESMLIKFEAWCESVNLKPAA